MQDKYMNDDVRQAVFDLTETWIGLYRTEFFLGDDYLRSVLDNQNSWGLGFDAMNDLYWCRPESADGRGPPIPAKFTSHSVRQGIVGDAKD